MPLQVGLYTYTLLCIIYFLFDKFGWGISTYLCLNLGGSFKGILWSALVRLITDTRRECLYIHLLINL